MELRPAKEGKQGLEGLLLSGNICYEGAWYCPKCEKALWLLERAPEGPAWLEPEEKKDEPAPPEPASAPRTEPPARRPKPRDDPWEEKGLFGRRKKPDWEK